MVRRPRAVIRNPSRSHRAMLTWLSAMRVMRSHTHSLWVDIRRINLFLQYLTRQVCYPNCIGKEMRGQGVEPKCGRTKER